MSGVINVHDNETQELVNVVIPGQIYEMEGTKRFKTCKFPKSDIGGTPCQAVVAGRTKTISSLDMSSLKLTHMCSTTFDVNSLAADYNTVAIAGEKTDVSILDWRTNQQSLTFEGHQDYVYSVDLNCDEHKMITGGQDLSARVWDLRNPSKELLLFPCTLSAANKVKFFSRSKVIIGETVDFVHMLDFETRQVDTQTVFGKLVGLDVTPSDRKLVWSVETFYLPGGIVTADVA